MSESSIEKGPKELSAEEEAFDKDLIGEAAALFDLMEQSKPDDDAIRSKAAKVESVFREAFNHTHSVCGIEEASKGLKLARDNHKYKTALPETLLLDKGDSRSIDLESGRDLLAA